MSGGLWIALCILLGVLWLELMAPQKLLEGFASLGTSDISVVSGDSGINPLTLTFAKRGDVGPSREEGGYKADKRYFAGWVDVQRIGEKNDYCRMVFPDGAKEEESFFACALGGTSGITSVSYRTKSIQQGLRVSRDDYMNNIGKDKRDAYCRILKDKDGTYQPLCLRADTFKFVETNQIDPEPPEEIKTLLDFYRGCQLWLRLRDDMLDYMGNTVIQVAGAPIINEEPRPTITRGLLFNGVNQFLRIGDSDDLSLGKKGSMQSIRAFSMWVRFNEFTNNAHIFDFGDGAGMNNVFLGILGKGDAGLNGASTEIRPKSLCEQTTVPTGKSGAQCVPEVRPQELVTLTRANIDVYTCSGPEVLPDESRARQILPEKELISRESPTRATLLYEVWDSRLRKMQIKLNGVFPIDKWTHIVITATNTDALRPNIGVYVNGNLYYTKEAGFLPQQDTFDKNYIGKSNWADADDEYELKDELFSGSLFDFRMYRRPLSETEIKRSISWGIEMLGIPSMDIANSVDT